MSPRTGSRVNHYHDVIMSSLASQITSLKIVYSIVYSDADQRKHQSSASLAFVRGIHRGPVNSPHKGPVTRKMFPFDDVIMYYNYEQMTSWDRCQFRTVGPRISEALFCHPPTHTHTHRHIYIYIYWSLFATSSTSTCNQYGWVPIQWFFERPFHI